MLNKLILMGRMTREPEMRATGNGKTVARFSLAVERDFKNADGGKETDFIDCICFGKTAEMAIRNLSKGRMVAVSGRLQINKWQDKEGNRRTSPEAVLDSIYFADNKRSAEEGNSQQEASHGAQAQDNANRFPQIEEYDDDLPF